MNELGRNYFYTESQLISYVRILHAFLLDDVEDLTEFGITIEKLNEFKRLINELEDFTSDIEFLGLIRISASVKDEKKSHLIKALREMEVRVTARFGNKSIEHKNLKLLNLERSSDDEIATRAHDTYSYLEKIQPELVEQGLTPEVLAALLVTIETYESAKIAGSEAKKNRLLGTRQRITMANHIFDLARAYANIAKRRFMYDSPARAKRYLLPKRNPIRVKKPTNFIYDNSSKIFSWDAQENATSYQLQVIKNNEYVEIYSGEANEFAYVLPSIELKYVVRARNVKGFGLYSDELILPNIN